MNYSIVFSNAFSTSAKCCGTYIILCMYSLPFIFLFTLDILTSISLVNHPAFLGIFITSLIYSIYMLIKDLLFTCKSKILQNKEMTNED